MRKCLVCKCDINHRGNRSVRCEVCQKIHRKWLKRQNNWKQIITKLGGKPVTLKEIRGYKNKALSNRCFTRNNEVENEDY